MSLVILAAVAVRVFQLAWTVRVFEFGSCGFGPRYEIGPLVVPLAAGLLAWLFIPQSSRWWPTLRLLAFGTAAAWLTVFAWIGMAG